MEKIVSIRLNDNETAKVESHVAKWFKEGLESRTIKTILFPDKQQIGFIHRPTKNVCTVPMRLWEIIHDGKNELMRENLITHMVYMLYDLRNSRMTYDPFGLSISK